MKNRMETHMKQKHKKILKNKKLKNKLNNKNNKK